jgi:hypothetical protein
MPNFSLAIFDLLRFGLLAISNVVGTPASKTPVRLIPMINDPADRQIGGDLRISRRDTRGGYAYREDEIAWLGTDRIERHLEIALVILDDPQGLRREPEIALRRHEITYDSVNLHPL